MVSNNGIPSSAIQSTASQAVGATNSVGAQGVQRAQGVDAIIANAKAGASKSELLQNAFADHV